MASITGNLHLFIQFMKSYGLLFFYMISWIFSLKKILLFLLTVFLELLQYDLDLETQYINKSLLQSSFHHAFEYLVILTHFEYLIQSSSIIAMNFWVIFFNVPQSEILVMSIHLTLLVSSLKNINHGVKVIRIVLISYQNLYNRHWQF